ncbi:nucleoside recognition domain-containing protein [Syntrophomonas wolfei]|uniref:Nucleoside recognition proteinn n=1 Tax=Syntrophomonas wolfei subsp. wolfei (strain DSM 2245B / Goettingen) TaxID=335541 RepID=Q0AWR2_SYNWW|nr:nucleoside recognition domain-containing protein [Syntrophomonas wolfei]ABI68842.1 nucleoside recognition proteinn [Syntrophomonas wolfei subsp. wolfei str. Goettingen G311]
MSAINNPELSVLREIEPLLPTNTANIKDRIVSGIYQQAESISAQVVRSENSQYTGLEARLDNILTSRWLGFPIMLLLLTLILWITITGANYPSQLLATGLFWLEEQLTALFLAGNAPAWLSGLLIQGMYRSLAWVVSVMLPPMAIFFPLFTLLEDLGYLPRVAFNMDNLFRRAGAHGKQCLTMCMGYGCNAAGVTSCRIIDSPRERLIAILTNTFSICNGRFPTLIALATIFMGALVSQTYSSILATLAVVGIIMTGIATTLLVSSLLSRTLLRGMPSFFVLELPPFRRPQLGQILIRSLLDRTLFVLWRAVVIAAPAGALTWILANSFLGETSVFALIAGWLNPLGQLMGMDGIILIAFLLGLPANEIVLPILIMGYISAGSMLELDSLNALRILLLDHGWTWITALCVMLFSLLHFPCGTTLYTIFKETHSARWTLLSALLPLLLGIIVTLIINQGAQIIIR